MSGSKNPLQAVKSCWTYLRRITLFSLLGLVDKDEIDDDGQGGASKRSPKPKSADVTASDEEKKAKNAFREMCLAKTGQKGLPGTVLWDILAEVQTRTGLKTTAECTDWLKNCEIKWDGTKAEIVIPQDVSPTIQDAEWLDESTIPDPDPSLLDEAIKNKRAR